MQHLVRPAGVFRQAVVYLPVCACCTGWRIFCTASVDRQTHCNSFNCLVLLLLCCLLVGPFLVAMVPFQDRYTEERFRAKREADRDKSCLCSLHNQTAFSYMWFQFNVCVLFLSASSLWWSSFLYESHMWGASVIPPFFSIQLLFCLFPLFPTSFHWEFRHSLLLCKFGTVPVPTKCSLADTRKNMKAHSALSTRGCTALSPQIAIWDVSAVM